jgi:hypothetical protein
MRKNNGNNNSDDNVMYMFLLPNEVKYRISRTKQLGTFKFDESNKCMRIPAESAIKDIKSYDVKDVMLMIEAEVITDIEKRKEIIKNLDILITLKKIAPKKQYFATLKMIANAERAKEQVIRKEKEIIALKDPENASINASISNNNALADFLNLMELNNTVEENNKEKPSFKSTNPNIELLKSSPGFIDSLRTQEARYSLEILNENKLSNEEIEKEKRKLEEQENENEFNRIMNLGVKSQENKV